MSTWERLVKCTLYIISQSMVSHRVRHDWSDLAAAAAAAWQNEEGCSLCTCVKRYPRWVKGEKNQNAE